MSLVRSAVLAGREAPVGDPGSGHPALNAKARRWAGRFGPSLIVPGVSSGLARSGVLLGRTPRRPASEILPIRMTGCGRTVAVINSEKERASAVAIEDLSLRMCRSICKNDGMKL